MKLSGKIISGFLLVSVIPLILMTLLLYLYVDSTLENVFLKKSELAIESFRRFLSTKLTAMEQNANRLITDKDFLISFLDLNKRKDHLTEIIDRQISLGTFQFALIKSEQHPELIKVCQIDLLELVQDYAPYLQRWNNERSVAGLVRLSAADKTSLAVVVSIPVFYQAEMVGRITAGKMLTNLVDGYQMSIDDLSGMIITCEEQITYARVDSIVAATLAQVCAIESDKGMFTVSILDHNYFVRETDIIDIDRQPIATIKHLFDRTEFSSDRSKLIRVLVMLSVAAILLSIVVGYLYSRFLLRPIVEMSEAAKKIGTGKVPERIHYFHDDELGNLVMGINRLTEDLKETEKKLRRSEQVAAWQLFARQTAHEIKNFLMPLSAVSAQMQRWAQQGSVDGEKLAEGVGNIQIEVGRMKRLLAAFSEFAKLPPPNLKKVELGRITNNLQTAFPDQSSDGRLHISLPEKNLVITCDPDQIRQVLFNLINNSFQAGATLVELLIESEVDKVWFEVADDGRGIDIAEGVDPFAPLYTTRQRGSGLGLAIVKRIVVDHGGDISYHPIPTGGTLFKFYLPV